MPNGHRTASIGFGFFWGIIVFCIFGLVAWLLFRFAAPQETFEDKRAKARVEKRDALKKENEQKLGAYAWVDKAKGSVQIPITRAMELAMADLKNKSVQASAVKVENPYPAGLQPPPGANPALAPTKAPGTNPSASPAPAAAPASNAPELIKAPPSPAAAPSAAAPATTGGTTNP